MGGGRLVLVGTKRLMAVGKPPDEGGGAWEARSGRYKAVNGRWETAGRGGVGGGRLVLVGTKRLMAVGKPPDEGGWGVGGSFWSVQSG